MAYSGRRLFNSSIPYGASNADLFAHIGAPWSSPDKPSYTVRMGIIKAAKELTDRLGPQADLPPTRKPTVKPWEVGPMLHERMEEKLASTGQELTPVRPGHSPADIRRRIFNRRMASK